MLTPAIEQAADRLLSALRQTDEFSRYQALKQAVMTDEVNSALLKRFAHAQTALQMAALAGTEPREADTAEFEKLSTLLYDSDELSDYLLAQMRAQQLLGETMERLTREVDLSIELPEL
ncbi:MAG: YlbF family regulator [Clostridia bacterium]